MRVIVAKEFQRVSRVFVALLALSALSANAFGQGQRTKPPQATPQAKTNQNAGNSASQGTPRIALGETDGSPGGTVMVPVYFTPDRKTPLRSISIEIDYVSNSLKFQKTSIADAAEQAGATVSATSEGETKDDKGVARSELRLSVSLPDQQVKEGIPEGLLTFLMFDIAITAKPFAIKLTPTLVSAEDLEGKKMADVRVGPGMVAVQGTNITPDATCFFFTH
jgi:hypothetical protein